jgi:hypothetical protein
MVLAFSVSVSSRARLLRLDLSFGTEAELLQDHRLEQVPDCHCFSAEGARVEAARRIGEFVEEVVSLGGLS